MINERIADYRLLEQIGCGGYGCVYKAQHIRLANSFVAVKLFQGVITTKEEYRQFKSQEPYTLDTLRHPHIIKIIDYGLYRSEIGANIPYIITEFAPRGSLRDRLNARPLLPISTSRTILTNIGEALQFAHQHYIVHRDLKPENILFNQDNQALLADFGISVILTSARTKYGISAGTAGYMSPEQITDGAISPRCDQYALACIAYELLVGQRPFQSKEQAPLMYDHINTPPPLPHRINPRISYPVGQVILKGLAKDSQDRYETVVDFLNELDDAFEIPRSTIRLTDGLQEVSRRHTHAPLDEDFPDDDSSMPRRVTRAAGMDNNLVFPRQEQDADQNPPIQRRTTRHSMQSPATPTSENVSIQQFQRHVWPGGNAFAPLGAYIGEVIVCWLMTPDSPYLFAYLLIMLFFFFYLLYEALQTVRHMQRQTKPGWFYGLIPIASFPIIGIIFGLTYLSLFFCLLGFFLPILYCTIYRWQALMSE